MPMVSGQPGKIHHFRGERNIETTGETPSFVYRYQMVMLSWITPGSWTTSRCRYWRGYKKSATVVAQSGA